LQIDSLVLRLWRLVTRIQIPASLNHRKVKKAEPSSQPILCFWRCQIFWL